MTHFLPTEFDETMSRIIAAPARGLVPSVDCSQPLVETTIIESKHGVAIPMINWSGEPVEGLQVTVALPSAPNQATLASGNKLIEKEVDGKRIFTLNLDVADALILR